MREVNIQLICWWLWTLLTWSAVIALATGELFTSLWLFAIALVTLVLLVAWGLIGYHKEKTRFNRMFGEN